MLFSKFLTLLICVCALLQATTTHALQCTVGQHMQHAFASGASWSFCAVLDEHHALELQQLHFQAPGDTSRKVLQHLHLGQALLHYHNEPTADVLIGENRLGGASLKTLTAQSCDGELHAAGNVKPNICSYVRNTGLLAKYNRRPGLQSEQFHLYSVSDYQGLTLQVQIGLSEDGRITPAVNLSGRSSAVTTDTRFGNRVLNPLTGETVISTQASVLFTWRMAFAINDDEQNDSVEEFNFKLEPSLGNRRPMIVTPLVTEALRNKNRNQFRGWRVKDINGSGYYLDPHNSGFGYSDQRNNWTQFDFALTAFNACERHSRFAASSADIDRDYECEGSLDNFVNGESMLNRNPVVWYSLSRVLRPNAEDFPAITSMQSDFEIIPFDWTPTSPFEVIE